MMRGPTYDDGYITRKMSSLHGPTFAPPGGAASYGRPPPPPMGGYMQHGGKKEQQMEKRPETLEKRRKPRSVSPSIPYFWPEKETSNMDRKKGWYRVDFGPQKTTQLWYLPTVDDRLKFLNRHKDSNPHEPFETPSPFPAEDEKQRSSDYWKTQRMKFPSTTRNLRKSKPLICLGNLPVSRIGAGRSSSVVPSPYHQIPRPGFVPSIGYEPMRSLSQPPTGAANAPGRVTSYISGYPPMGPPPPRMVPRMGPPPPGYYDYDYGGYGGGYGGYGGYGYGGYAPPPPRMSRYETYLDDELPEPTYTPRHRSRVPDTLDDMDVRDKGAAPVHHPPPHHHQALVPMPPSVTALRDLPPMSINDVDDSYSEQPRRLRKAHLQSSPGIEPPPHLHVPGGETEGDRQLAKMQARYPSLSEPQMLQDHVDKMRIRLKSIAFSLDPSGPVPDIIVPDRPKKGGADADKKYSQALEFNDLPKVATRRQRYYPEDEYLKDNLRIKCLSHYKTTRTAADAQMSTDYWKPKQYNPDDYKVPSDSSSSRYDKLAGAKWEEPDTVFGTPSEKKPFSKSLTDGTTEESDERKERRKKKKSKERDLPETPALEAPPAQSSSTPAPPSDFSTTSEVESAAKDAVSIGDEEGMDEKELKKLEKKKRKAEREAAAKAAMEAELAALAAAEAELARLEAETSTLKTDSPAPAPAEVSAPAEVPTPAAPAKEPSPAPAPAPAEPATEVKSESAAEKSGEPSKAAKKFQSATNKIMAVGAFLRTHVAQKKSSGTEAAPVEDLPPSTEPPAAAGTEDALSGNEEGKPNVSAAGEDDGGTYVIDAAAAAVAAAAAANRSEDLE